MHRYILPVHRYIYRWTAKFTGAPVKYNGAAVIFTGPPVNFTGAPVKTLIFYFNGVAIKYGLFLSQSNDTFYLALGIKLPVIIRQLYSWCVAAQCILDYCSLDNLIIN